MSRKHKQPRIDPLVSDALRDHAMLARWHEKPAGRRYARGFSQYDGLLSETFRRMRLDGEREFPDYLLHMLRIAETFAIQRDMHELVSGLARGSGRDTIPPEICLHDLPAPDGFVRMPEAIHVRDIKRVDYPIRAFAWYTDPLRCFADIEVNPMARRDGFSMDGVIDRRESESLPVVSVALFSEQWPEDPAREEFRGRPPGPKLSLLHFAGFNLKFLHSAWDAGSQGGWPEDFDEHELLDYQFAARYMVLFWLVANQKLAAHRVYADQQVGGVTAMRAREAKIVPRIRVIALRREHVRIDPEEEGSGRDYSHRWTVRAHWRHQACGPGRTERRWVLVQAHIKGPDDKPLVVKERAFDLRR